MGSVDASLKTLTINKLGITSWVEQQAPLLDPGT
jgi:hypothetical protein